MTFWILNGPNLDLLGQREPALYGTQDYAALVRCIGAACAARGIDCVVRQTNHEGVLLDWIREAYRGGADGLILNPAAYTHTSIALLDAVQAVRLPTVEVHLTDPDGREPFRRVSYVRQACLCTIKGKGFAGYEEAVERLYAYLTGK